MRLHNQAAICDKSGMYKKLKKFVDFIRELEAWHGLFSWKPILFVLSILSSALAFVLGWLQGVPWMWIFVAVLLAAAALSVITSTLLFLIPRLAYARSVEHKLNFEDIEFRPTIDANRHPVAFKAFNIGVGLANTATFPICFIVDDWQLVLNGRTISERKPRIKYTIQPMSAASYRDLDVEFQERFGSEIKGSLRFSLRYGRESRQTYKIEREIHFVLVPDGGDRIGFAVQNVTTIERGEDGINRELGLRSSPLLSSWPGKPQAQLKQRVEIK